VDYGHDLRTIDDATALVAEAVHRRLATVAALWQEIEQGGRNGRAVIRQAVLEIGTGARSAPEARAARLLRGAALGPFEQNAVVWAMGRRFVADFLWRRWRAILEIDSYEHHYSPEDWRATMRRHLLLESAGYSVVHVPPSGLATAEEFVAHIREWLGACAARGPVINSRPRTLDRTKPSADAR
jgi:very-short-patch-repair endonuclease